MSFFFLLIRRPITSYERGDLLRLPVDSVHSADNTIGCTHRSLSTSNHGGGTEIFALGSI